MKYVVIGAGRQGVAAAYDLAVFGGADQIQLLDIDKDTAEGGAARLNRLLGADVAKGAAVDAGNVVAVRPYLDGAKGCISSVHFTFNLALTRLAIEKGVHLTDFGGNTGVVRQQLELDGEARAAGVSVVPDCGMGPGLNISLGTYVMSLLEEPKEVLIWDGGLPQNPQPPWNYACAFALGGLTNEYDGDAYFLREGQVTPVPCFSGYELLEFPEPIGRLEAFVTSGGLSTAPWTFEGKLVRLENKTLRYPGHVAQFKTFADLGLLGLEPVDVGGRKVVPRDVFHALLAPRIQCEDFKDVCVMRVKGVGLTKGRPAEAVVELVDRYDERTGFTAMQRLTGWHASIMLIAAVNRQVRPGVVSVEQALPGKSIVDESRRRGFNIQDRVHVQ
jgi:lysine 6-dehydrogenase